MKKKRQYLIGLYFMFFVILIYFCYAELSELQKTTCNAAEQYKSCGEKLESYGIVTNRQCCEGLSKCCGYVQGRCEDGTVEGRCSATKPKYCNNKILIDNCEDCGCQEGKVCQGDGTCKIKCLDGTLPGLCSIIKPKYCDDGRLVDNCEVCGCDRGLDCIENACVAAVWEKCSECGTGLFNTCDKIECEASLEGCYFIPWWIGGGCYQCKGIESCESYKDEASCNTNNCNIGNCGWVENRCVNVCSDGTLYGQCLSTKPEYCHIGIVLDRCDFCGCPEGKSCQDDGTCGECGAVVKSFDKDPSITLPLAGIEYENGHLWVSESSEGREVKKVYKLDANTGQILDSYLQKSTLSGPNYVDGLAYDATNNILYNVMYRNGPMVRVDATSLQELNRYSIDYSNLVPFIMDIAFDGKNLWSVKSDIAFNTYPSHAVYKFTPANNQIPADETILGVFIPPVYSNVGDLRGITWDGYNIWISEGSNGQIYKIDQNRALENIIGSTRKIITSGEINFGAALDEESGVLFSFKPGIEAHRLAWQDPYYIWTTNGTAIFKLDVSQCGKNLKCSDGTPYGRCSANKRFYCGSGSLIENRCDICGCPEELKCRGDGLCYDPRYACSDGTLYGQCSYTHPKKYCDQGILVDNCRFCSCAEGQTICYNTGSCAIGETIPINLLITRNVWSFSPDIYNNKVVWWTINLTDYTRDIKLYDLSSNSYIQTSIPKKRENPAIYGDNIVYDGVYMYNMASGQETFISSGIEPDIYGNNIVFMKRESLNYYVYIYNLLTGSTQKISHVASEQKHPAIYGDKVVWEDNRNGDWDIYMYDLSTGQETRITSDNKDQIYPAVYNNQIVWQDNRDGNWQVFMYDLSIPKEIQITSNVDSRNDKYPRIYGDKIVWQDWRSDNWDIYMYDLSTGRETRITTASGYDSSLGISGPVKLHETNPVIYGDKIAFIGHGYNIGIVTV